MCNSRWVYVNTSDARHAVSKSESIKTVQDIVWMQLLEVVVKIHLLSTLLSRSCHHGGVKDRMPAGRRYLDRGRAPDGGPDPTNRCAGVLIYRPEKLRTIMRKGSPALRRMPTTRPCTCLILANHMVQPLLLKRNSTFKPQSTCYDYMHMLRVV